MSGVEVARTVEEVEALRPLWERFQGASLTSDIDFFLTHVRHAPAVVRPHVVVVERDGEPAALVVARLEHAAFPAKLGYRTVASPRLRTISVVYGGLLGPLVETDPAAVLAALGRSTGRGEADVVRLRMAELGSPVYEAARAGVPFLRRGHFGEPAVHWRSELPGSLDEFLARRSRRRRESVRRYNRRLEKTYGDELAVRVVRERDGLEQLFAESEIVHRTTYQHALGVGFSTGELNRRLTELAMDRGWFRGYILSLQDVPVAFWHGNAYRGAFGIGATGFDPAHAQDRPGTFLFMRLIDDLCIEGSVATLDFGFGDAEYKRHFGDESRLEEDVPAFEPTLRALSANAARTTLAGVTLAGKSVLDRTGKLGNLRRRRRGRLTRQSGG